MAMGHPRRGENREKKMARVQVAPPRLSPNAFGFVFSVQLQRGLLAWKESRPQPTTASTAVVVKSLSTRHRVGPARNQPQARSPYHRAAISALPITSLLLQDVPHPAFPCHGPEENTRDTPSVSVLWNSIHIRAPEHRFCLERHREQPKRNRRRRPVRLVAPPATDPG